MAQLLLNLQKGGILKINFNTKEVTILLAASLMSFLANIPDSILGNLVDKRILLVALATLVVVAMFRYLRMLLLFTISILAIGANLPAEMASMLGISQTALLVSLGFVVAITLLNRYMNWLPTDKESPPPETGDVRQAMLAAIEKGDKASVERLLAMNTNVNFTLNGTTPLHLAAEKGYPEIVRLLIAYGADFQKENAEGKTPLDVALAKMKFIQTEEILINANNTYGAIYGRPET
ncbi:ankyrin repeat protein [mine drainage metagenome]|uniref:Ankyrin repeat protein n=1 Tax=mine drainage metagenome TaxID=410659 RepID=A0A1J5SW10_9ZZZZ